MTSSIRVGPATATAAPAARGSTALFSGTLLLGAILLFSVQPMFARMVLPVLGGTSGVWATSMVFFQTALLAAYGYAHWSVRRLGSRRQSLLHLALLLPPLLVLPAGIPAGWVPPAGGQPELWLLGLLAVAIGPPFVVVAATAPLLQRWYVDSGHPRGADPYFLYRASNLGSIVGLLGYPLLLEPLLPLAAQARVWTAGYLLLLLLVAACAVVLHRSGPAPAGSAAGSAAAGSAAAGSGPAGLGQAGSAAAGSEPAGSGPVGSGPAGLAPAGVGPAVPAAGRVPVGGPSAGRRWQPGRWAVARWLALAFVPSCLLIGVTNVLTTDLAPIPLLWVLPLTIYLGTFVVAFSPTQRAARAWLWSRRLLPPLAALGLWVLLSGATQPLAIFLPLHLVIFAVAGLLCHGRLAAERPPADALTGFYLALAAGGALGGAAAGLVAPVLFDHLLEYPLGLTLALFAVPLARPARSRPAGAGPSTAAAPAPAGIEPAVARPVAVGPAGIEPVGTGPAGDESAGREPAGIGSAGGAGWSGGGVVGRVRPMLVAVLLPAAVAGGLLLVDRLARSAAATHRIDLLFLLVAVGAGLLLRPVPVRAVALGLVFLVASSTLARLDGVIFADRSFYGTLAVRHTADGTLHVLMHGTTIHGAQFTDLARRTVPLTYFTLAGPAGDVVRAARAAGHADRVAVIGLGAGTLACQGQPGERYTFYEIDPLVARIAADPALFSYLRDCPARSAVVLGDGRVSLAGRPDARYGLIMLDAFSSDSVPVHLLTRQAVELYLARLDPGGLVALHLTNRYLDLEPVAGRVAAAVGAACLSRVDPQADQTSAGPGRFGSHWLALARTPADLATLRADPGWQPCRVGAGRAWTDDYANVVGALGW